MFDIKLKSRIAIEKLCYTTTEGILGQDSIAFNYELLKSNGFRKGRIIGLTPFGEEGELSAYILEGKGGLKTLIHIEWIAEFNGEISTAHKEVDSNRLIVTETFVLLKDSMELVKRASLGLCECGNIVAVTTSDGATLCKECSAFLVEPHNYSYRPEYKYLGKQIGKDKKTPVWYGLEVEVSTEKEKLRAFMGNNTRGLYLKSDSSIQGGGTNVEIVSHPHSFSELMKRGSWLEQIASVPTNSDERNGCHIHISRTSFTDDKHYGLFYFLLHKMSNIATIVGGRELTNYCKLSPTGRVYSKSNLQGTKSRELFLNERNLDTVEARFFKGTTNTSNLKAYVQFMESMIKYTKYHSKTVSSKGWFAYITKKSFKYSELLSVLDKVTEDMLAHTVTYKKPTLITTDIGKVPLNKLSSVVSFTRTAGLSEIKVEGISHFYVEQDYFSYDTVDCRDETTNLSDIVSVTYEEL